MSNKNSNCAVKAVQEFLEKYLQSETPQKVRGVRVPYRFISGELSDELLELDCHQRFPEIDAELNEQGRIDGLIAPDDPDPGHPKMKYMSKEARRISKELREKIREHESQQALISAYFAPAVLNDYNRDAYNQSDSWPSYRQLCRMMEDWDKTPEGMRGFAVWFVGYPGSGKTTLAGALYLRLSYGVGVPLLMFDNDLQRNRDLILTPALGHFFTIGGVKGMPDFSRESRLERTKRLASQIGRMSNGGIVVGASFCPLPEQRRMLAAACRGRFVLVHVATPIGVCKRRRKKEGYFTDPKKDCGIADFTPPTGAPGDVPPDLVIDTASEPLWKSIARVMRVLHERRWMGMPEYLRSQ